MTKINDATLDATAETILEVLEDWKNGDGTMGTTNAVLDFLERTFENPSAVSEYKLEYHQAVDPGLEKGKEIISKLGPDATFRDLDEAMKNGTISAN